jgi:hypothetical protein
MLVGVVLVIGYGLGGGVVAGELGFSGIVNMGIVRRFIFGREQLHLSLSGCRVFCMQTCKERGFIFFRLFVSSCFQYLT